MHLHQYILFLILLKQTEINAENHPKYKPLNLPNAAFCLHFEEISVSYKTDKS